MTSKKEPYSYFQPGEIFYFISHKSDKPINRTTGISKPDKPLKAESSSSENEEPIHPEISGSEGGQSSDAEPDDDNKGSDDDHGDDDDLSYDEKIDRLISWSNQVAQKLELKLEIVISRDKKRELHFPGTLGEVKPEFPEFMYHGAFSLIPAQVRVSENDENWKKSGFRTNPYRYVPQSELAKMVVGLDDRRNAAEQPLQMQGITLEAVSPNWLSSPCSEYGGGGGPGGFPEPYPNKSVDPHLFEFPKQKSFQAALAQGGKGVIIAILDTAPSLKDLAAAYERHHKVDPINQVPPEYDQVFEGLLGPQGHLVVHPASIEELLRMRAVHLRDHNYVMTDHGLTVSSIAYQLAPEATIHLYEVLNHQGVGDLLSIAKGFWRVFMCFSRDPLVVNCSLVLNIPLLNQPIKNLDQAFWDKIIKPEIVSEWLTLEILKEDAPGKEGGLQWLARQGEAIQWICDHLYVRGSRVVAAAGNDRRSDENKNIRPQARYPAGFESALGVGVSS